MAQNISLVLFSFFLLLLSRQSHAELQNLRGARKGVTLPELHQLKSYLHRFGYLTSTPSKDDNNFDDTLEVALKMYQTKFLLKPTGSLDAETVSMMMMPRCGVPDIIHDTAGIQAEGHHHHDTNNSYVTVSLFNIQGSKWKNMPVTYRFVTDMPPSFQSAIRQAMSTWSAATNNHLSFQQVASGETISIGFFSGDHGDNRPFDGPGNVLAHGFFPKFGGDLHMDATERWSTANPYVPGTIDVESIALHELGHTLGLQHSYQGTIMQPGYPGGRLTTLTPDDINGIQNLYGS